MRPFRFRLETVSRLRDHAERTAREDLARELVVREARAGDLERSRDALRSAAASARSADAAALASWQAFIERCQRDQTSAEAALRAQNERVVERQAHLARASREREVLDKLEERHRADHRREEQRAQDAELTDVALAAFNRAERSAA